jgi:hypothetical protein
MRFTLDSWLKRIVLFQYHVMDTLDVILPVQIPLLEYDAVST